MQDTEPKLVGDIIIRCNNNNDCPIELMCENNTCRKPGPSSVYILRGKHKCPIFQKLDHTFDKLLDNFFDDLLTDISTYNLLTIARF